MTEHTMSGENYEPRAEVYMMAGPRTKNSNHKDHHMAGVIDWILKIGTAVMLAIIVGGGSWIFSRVIGNQSEITSIKVSLEAIVDSNKIVNEQQNQHLVILAQHYDKLSDKIDGLRGDIQKLSHSHKVP